MTNELIEPTGPVHNETPESETPDNETPDAPPAPEPRPQQAADISKAMALATENVEFFHTLISSLYSEFKPASTVEIQLVENIAVARWRQMRLWGLEKAAVDDEFGKSHMKGSPASETVLALRNIMRESRWTEYLGRSETRIEQQYRRSLRAFREHRAWRLDRSREIL